MARLRTSDGVMLHYEEAGTGAPLVMIPGWSQTAAQFKHQPSGLGDRYRVIALDMRGHDRLGEANARRTTAAPTRRPRIGR